VKKIIEKINWLFDYNIMIFLYGPNKLKQYSLYMNNKWNKKTIKNIYEN